MVNMASRPTLRILRRTLRLPQLQQGGTLSISASHLVPPQQQGDGSSGKHGSKRPALPPLPRRLPPLTVRIVPGWRDDAEVELWQQIFAEGGEEEGATTTSGPAGSGDGDRDAAAAATAAEPAEPEPEPEPSNRHLTDGLVVGMGAVRITGSDDGDGGAAPPALAGLGRSTGDICLRLGLGLGLGRVSGAVPPFDDESSKQRMRRMSSSNDELCLANDIDVHDMEVPVEYEDDDDDSDSDSDSDEEEEEEERSRFVLGNDVGNDAAGVDNDGGDDDDQEDDIFDPSDDHGLNSLVLIATVPEKCNLRCHLDGPGSIVVEGKLEGQHGFDLATAGGNIKVKKLRGDSVRLVAGCAAGSNDDGRGGGNSGGASGEDADVGTASGNRVTGIVYATDLVEARTVSIEAEGRMRAKMVNGTDVRLSVASPPSSGAGNSSGRGPAPMYIKPLEVDDTGALIDIGSLYTTKNGDGANVEVLGSITEAIGTPAIPRAVRIKSSHGHVSVAAALGGNSKDGTSTADDDSIGSNVDEFDQTIPVVELGGVNGSCDVIINNKSEEEVDGGGARCVSARIHVDSLTPDSVSFVSAGYGNVDLTVDRKVEADLRLVSSSSVTEMDVDALLVDDEDGVRKECARLDSLSHRLGIGRDDPTSVITKDTQQSIYVQTNSFSPRHRETLPNGTEHVEGSIHNRSFEPDSRFDVKTKHSPSTDAADINRGIGKVNIMGAAAQALSGFSGKKGGEQNPLFAVASSGSIKVETVSWFGAIARRYGMDDRGRKDVGRTASREKRLK